MAPMGNLCTSRNQNQQQSVISIFPPKEFTYNVNVDAIWYDIVNEKSNLPLKSMIFTQHTTFIGGHGFLDGVGVHTPRVGQKICRPPKAAQIFLLPGLSPGGDITK